MAAHAATVRGDRHALAAGSPLDTQGAITLALSFLIGNGLIRLAARGLLLRAASPLSSA